MIHRATRGLVVLAAAATVMSAHAHHRDFSFIRDWYLPFKGENEIESRTGWIPANLLNEGRHSVEAGVYTLHAPKLHPRAWRPDAVSFHVFDPGDGDSARGRFTGQLRGAVRPLLEWTTERLD